MNTVITATADGGMHVSISPVVLNVTITPTVVNVATGSATGGGGGGGVAVAVHEALFHHEDIALNTEARHTHANKAELDDYDPNQFDPSGLAAEIMADHNMELDPHTQYQLKNELPGFITPPPNDGNYYLLRNGQWEILNIT